MESILKNCGTGKGGFQPGNDCAGGGGSDSLERVSRSGKPSKNGEWYKNPLPRSKRENDMEVLLSKEAEDLGMTVNEYISIFATEETVSISALTSGQTIVSVRDVDHFKKDSNRSDLKLPLIVQYGDEMIIRDGNTRTVADLVNGKDKIQARVLYVSDKNPTSKPVKKSTHILPHEAHLAATLRPSIADSPSRRDRIVGATAEVAAETAAYVAHRLGYDAFDTPQVSTAIRALANVVADRAVAYLDENPDADPDAVAVYQYVRTQAMAGDLMARIIQDDLDAGRVERFSLPLELVEQLEARDSSLESVHKSCGAGSEGDPGFQEGNDCAKGGGKIDEKVRNLISGSKFPNAEWSPSGKELKDGYRIGIHLTRSKENAESIVLTGVKPWVDDNAWFYTETDVEHFLNSKELNRYGDYMVVIQYNPEDRKVATSGVGFRQGGIDPEDVLGYIYRPIDRDSVHKSIVMQAFARSKQRPKRGRPPLVTVRVDTRLREPTVLGALKVRRIWRTEEDDKVCPICTDLEDEYEDYWDDEYPDGPPAHPNCRCRLDYEYKIKAPPTNVGIVPPVIEPSSVEPIIGKRAPKKKPPSKQQRSTKKKPPTPKETRRWGGRKLEEMFKSQLLDAGSHLPEPDFLRPGSIYKTSGCGAGSEGSPGFEPGNDCAKSGGSNLLKDSSGRLIVLYTGQPKGLTEFSASEREEFPGEFVFLSSDEDVAEHYAGTSEREQSGRTDYSTGRQGEVYSVHITDGTIIDGNQSVESGLVRLIHEHVGADTVDDSLLEAFNVDTEYDDYSERTIYLIGNVPVDLDDLDHLVDQAWAARSGSGDTLEYAIRGAPTAQALALLSTKSGDLRGVAEAYLESKDAIGIKFTDEEMGGTTYAIRPDHVKISRPGSVKKSSNCGANQEGGGGFVEGNTCATESGTSSGTIKHQTLSHIRAYVDGDELPPSAGALRSFQRMGLDAATADRLAVATSKSDLLAKVEHPDIMSEIDELKKLDAVLARDRLYREIIGAKREAAKSMTDDQVAQVLKVEVYSSMKRSNLSPEKQKEYFTAASTAIESMTPGAARAAFGNVARVQFYESVQDVTPALSRMFPDANLSGATTAACFAFGKAVPGSGTLHLDGEAIDPSGAKVATTLEIYEHELAHAFDGGLSRDDSWVAAWEEEMSLGRLNDYSASATHEGLAELYRVASGERRKTGGTSLIDEHFPECMKVLRDRGLF